MNLLTGGYWIGVPDGDPRVVDIYERHYSGVKSKATRQARLRAGISGVGESMVLLTSDNKALWVWRHNTIARDDGQVGVECSVFRNEGLVLSSLLIIEAVDLAWQRWQGQRLFTYVWDSKVRSVNPGYCYKQAGWKVCGRNKDGRLTILELLPLEQPAQERLE